MKKLLLLLIAVVVIGFFIVKPYIFFVTRTLGISPLKTLFPGNSLAMTNNQTNILIMGIGGGNHDGPNLSDSMIMVNYDFQTNRLTTIGIPRDLWSPPLHDKINSAYAYGVAKGNTTTGLQLAKASVEALTNQPIHYAIVIDFDQFKKLIDFLGGVDIKVQHPFSDNQFPIEGKENDLCGGDPDYKCRYTTVSFDKGMQHMDGERALTFARSRHAIGGEGSDFARSQRQQLIIAALKDKMINLIKSGDIDKITSLYKIVDQSLIRDLDNQRMALIVKNILLKKNFSQKNDILPEDLFEVPDASDYNGAYVLIPKHNNRDLLKDYINCEITQKNNCPPT